MSGEGVIPTPSRDHLIRAEKCPGAPSKERKNPILFEQGNLSPIKLFRDDPSGGLVVISTDNQGKNNQVIPNVLRKGDGKFSKI
jgi:hypothetical protein